MNDTSDLMQAAGTPRTITLGGKTVKVSQLTVEMYGELANLVAAKKAGIIDVALAKAAKCPPHLQDKLLAAAVAEACPTSVRGEDFGAFCGLSDGMIDFAHLVLREHQPDLTPEEIRAWLGKLPAKTVSDALSTASGLVAAKN